MSLHWGWVWVQRPWTSKHNCRKWTIKNQHSRNLFTECEQLTLLNQKTLYLCLYEIELSYPLNVNILPPVPNVKWQVETNVYLLIVMLYPPWCQYCPIARLGFVNEETAVLSIPLLPQTKDDLGHLCLCAWSTIGFSLNIKFINAEICRVITVLTCSLFGVMSTPVRQENKF